MTPVKGAVILQGFMTHMLKNTCIRARDNLYVFLNWWHNTNTEILKKIAIEGTVTKQAGKTRPSHETARTLINII